MIVFHLFFTFGKQLAHLVNVGQSLSYGLTHVFSRFICGDSHRTVVVTDDILDKSPCDERNLYQEIPHGLFHSLLATIFEWKDNLFLQYPRFLTIVIWQPVAAKLCIVTNIHKMLAYCGYLTLMFLWKQK